MYRVHVLALKTSRFIFLLVTFLPMHGWTRVGFAPQGCSYSRGAATCDFQRWTPPLRDEDFGPEQLKQLRLHNISGPIPAGAFSGLHGPPLMHSYSLIYLYCEHGKTRLSREIFSENLHWVVRFMIYGCTLENGLPSRVLENLSSLRYLDIIGDETDGIEGMVEHDALAGLANLISIYISAPVEAGKLPHYFFDGLINITRIYLIHSGLNVIPANWFNGLVTLQRIYISNNNLCTLPPGLFKELPSLTYVKLDANPWNCSCSLMWLLDWLHIIDPVGVICQYPPVMRNSKLENVTSLLYCTTSTATSLLSPESSSAETKHSYAINSTSNNNVGIWNDDYAIMISAVGTTPVLLVFAVAVILCRRIFRNKCNQKLNRVNSGEEGRHGQNPHSRDTTLSSLAAGPTPDEL